MFDRLTILMESRIRGNVYVRFGGEYLETDHRNMIRRRILSLLKETVKIFEQGKAYYDALKNVHNLVKDAQKVKETILMIGEISEIYVESFQRMLADPNFTVEELAAIAEGYAILLTESGHVLNELKEVVNINGLSLTDKDRMDVVHRAYREVYKYRNLVKYYTNKNISVSYLRAKQKNEIDRILSLYGNPIERYW